VASDPGLLVTLLLPKVSMFLVVPAFLSSARGDLAVPRTKTSTYGPRSFAVWGPTNWNSLPQSFRDAAPTLGQFQRRLKTSLFRLAYGRDLTAHS